MSLKLISSARPNEADGVWLPPDCVSTEASRAVNLRLISCRQSSPAQRAKRSPVLLERPCWTHFPDLQEPLQERTVGQAEAKFAVIESRETAGNVGAQGEHTESNEAFQAFGGGGLGVDLVLDEHEIDELLFEAGGGEDRVDALENGALLAVVQGTVNARKCWTEGGLVGEADQGSGAGLLS
jgi:hypothetical protein